MRRVLVTGATGGLGRNAVEALLRQGTEVRATGRRADVGAQLAADGAEFVALDLATATPAALAEALQDVDTVWHCAALSSPWGRPQDFEAANVTATRKLLQTAGDGAVQRFVHISTPAIYFDYRHRRDVPESFRPARYVNDYARTKAEAEHCVQAAVMAHRHMHCTILRPRAIFGPHDQVLLPRLARVIAERGGRLPLPRGGRAVIDMTYVGNVVQAMQLASAPGAAQRLPSGSAFNITNQAPAALRDVLTDLFMRQLGRPLTIVGLPYPLMAGVARAMVAMARATGREPLLTPYSVGALAFDMTLDNRRAQDVLGYRPRVGLAEGVRRTAAWMKEQEQARMQMQAASPLARIGGGIGEAGDGVDAGIGPQAEESRVHG